MVTYKINPIIKFFRILWDIIKLSIGIIGTILLLFFMGIFLASLSIRNAIIKRRNNIRNMNE